MSEFLPCAVLVPSLNRPQRLRETVASIHAATPEAHYRLFCVSDAESKDILTELGEWFIDDAEADDQRYVTRMNKLTTHIGDAKTIFFGSDDVRFRPGWLTQALRVLTLGPSVVVVNDLRNPNGTQAVIRSTYLKDAVFDAPGDAFHRGYLHNFADTEMFFTAFKRQVIARAMESVVEHLHPVFGGPDAIPWDSTYEGAVWGWDHDQKLFRARAAMIREAIK